MLYTSILASYRELADVSRKAIGDVLAKNVNDLDRVLGRLTLSEHSIGILAIM